MIMSDTANPTIRVLVVDDEPSIIDAYRQIFTGPSEDAAVARRSLGTKLFGAGAPQTSRPRLPSNTLSFDAVFCKGASRHAHVSRAGRHLVRIAHPRA
jgi:hypothetical protein